MEMERINPAGLARPSGFSHAVSAPAGRLVFLAGQTGMDQGGQIVPGGVVAQFEQALSNLLAALTAAGGRPSDLASVTIYLTDVEDYQAMAGVGVTRLWQPDAVVEIQGFAVVSRS